MAQESSHRASSWKTIHTALVLRWMYLVGLCSLLRVLFYLSNDSFFSFEWNVFFTGMRYDVSIVTLLSLSFLVIESLPFRTVYNTVGKVLGGIGFALAMLGLLLPALIDTAFFEYSKRRSTASILDFATAGGDTTRALPAILLSYLGLMFFALLAIWVSVKVWKATSYSKITAKTSGFAWVRWVVALGCFVLAIRGGLQLKPISSEQVTRYVSSQNASLALNSSFTIVESIGEEDVQWVPVWEYILPFENQGSTIAIEGKPRFKGYSVVVLILESFGTDYIGYYDTDTEHTHTPFLDSLLRESEVYVHSFSNGLHSIDAMPSIFAGVPALFPKSYSLTKYGRNQIYGWPSHLRDQGYETRFYHGGFNGTFGIDAFVKKAGFETYFGKDEYPLANQSDFDGIWGIYDFPYLQYFKRQLDNTPRPFAAAVFTLSSHHPFQLPADWESKIPRDEAAILRTVHYTDAALQAFFSEAARSTWYDSTLFLITADHTSLGTDKAYPGPTGTFRVPIALYSPSILPKKDSTLMQHIDIGALVLRELGSANACVSFGNSAKKSERFALQRFGNEVLFSDHQHTLRVSLTEEGECSCFNYKEDPLFSQPLPCDSITFPLTCTEAKARLLTIRRILEENTMVSGK